MHRYLSSVFLCATLSLSGDVVLRAEDSGPGEAEKQKIDVGRVNISGVLFEMQDPTLQSGMSASEQTSRLKPILAGLSMRQFTRSSAVAPVRIKLKYIKDDSGKRVGHDIHLAFVAYAPIDEFSDDKLSRRMFGDEETAADDDSTGSSTEVSAQELESAGIKDQGERVRYQRFTFDLLDKVKLSGVIRAEHSESEKQRRIDLALDERFPNGWASLSDDENATADTKAYSGGRAWIAVTELAKEFTSGKDAVLIEARIAMHEPGGWFAGSNFLRSKLPLVLQESARNLRRGLK